MGFMSSLVLYIRVYIFNIRFSDNEKKSLSCQFQKNIKFGFIINPQIQPFVSCREELPLYASHMAGYHIVLVIGFLTLLVGQVCCSTMLTNCVYYSDELQAIAGYHYQ
jgi:hypothetical protein